MKKLFSSLLAIFLMTGTLQASSCLEIHEKDFAGDPQRVVLVGVTASMPAEIPENTLVQVACLNPTGIPIDPLRLDWDTLGSSAVTAPFKKDRGCLVSLVSLDLPHSMTPPIPDDHTLFQIGVRLVAVEDRDGMAMPTPHYKPVSDSMRIFCVSPTLLEDNKVVYVRFSANTTGPSSAVLLTNDMSSAPPSSIKVVDSIQALRALARFSLLK